MHIKTDLLGNTLRSSEAEHMSKESIPCVHPLVYETSAQGTKFEMLAKMASSECNTRLDEHHVFISELVQMYQQALTSLRELGASLVMLTQGTNELDRRMGALEERLEGKRENHLDCGLPLTSSSSAGEKNNTAIHDQLKLLLESERQAWEEHAKAGEELHKRELQEFRATFTQELMESLRRESEKHNLEMNRLQNRLEVVNRNIEGRGLQIDKLSRCLQAVSHEGEEENMKPDQEDNLDGRLDKVREVAKGETSAKGKEFSQRYHEVRKSYSSLLDQLSIPPKPNRMSKDPRQLALT